MTSYSLKYERVLKTLTENERLRKTLFEDTDDAFQLLELIYDDTGRPVDCLIIKVNNSFEKLINLQAEECLGRRVKEFFPDTEDYWFEEWDKVQKTRRSSHFENFRFNSNRWLDIFSFPYGSGQVGVLFRDITTNKSVQLDKKLTAMTLATSELIYQMNSDWSEMVQLNCRGFLKNAIAPDANWVKNYIPPEEQQLVLSTIKNAINNKMILELEHRIYRPDGSIGWVHTRAVPFIDDTGNITAWFGAANDITERKNVAEDLKRSNCKINDILSSIQDDFYVLDRNWDFIYTNRQFTSRIGKEPEDFIGNNIWEMFPKHIGTDYEENLRAVMDKRETRRFDVVGKYTDACYRMAIFPTEEGITALGIDITDQWKAEKALRISEEKYRTLFNCMNEGFSLFEVIHDNAGIPCDFRFLEINKAYEDHTGLKPADIIGKTLLEIASDIESSWIEIMIKVVITGEPTRTQDYNQSTKKYYETLAFSPQKGKIALLLKDITEQKQIETTLRESEKMLRTVLENSRDGINMLDLTTGRYAFMSPAQVELTGFTAEEMNNISAEEAYDRMHPEDRQISVDQQNLVAEGLGDISAEYRWKVKSGEYRWFSDRRKLIRDAQGYPVALVGVSRDITERKKMEEELKRQRDLNRAIIEHMADGLFLLDKDNKFTMLNQGGKDFFYQPENILKNGDSFSHTKYFDMDGNELSVENMVGSRALKGERIAIGRIKAVRPDKTVYFSLSGSPIYDSEGNITSAIICSRDITEQVHNEYAKNESLENAMIMKDEFLATMTHEFKTPLNVINAALQTIEIKHGEQLSDSINKHLNKIKRSSYRQLRLVNNLLDITRFKSGHLKVELYNLDIVYLTKSIINSVDIYASQKGVELFFSSDTEFLEMAIDEEKYERSLLNLLSNAIKFTPQGKSIYISLTSLKKKVVIIVKDEGIGIPKSKQKIIFERFGQVDSSLSRRAEGTGIGLSLVKTLITGMNGTVTVDSEVGQGCTFTITLPIEKLTSKAPDVKMDGLSDSRIVQAVAIEFSDHY